MRLQGQRFNIGSMSHGLMQGTKRTSGGWRWRRSSNGGSCSDSHNGATKDESHSFVILASPPPNQIIQFGIIVPSIRELTFV